jgi:hypothetical protein
MRVNPVIVVMAVVGAAGLNRAGIAGTATGVLHVNDREIALRHAYAVAEVPELAFPGQPKDAYDLIISDRALTDAERGCRTLLMRNVGRGDVHGVILTITPGKQDTSHGAILYGRNPAFFSVTGTNDQYKIEAKTLTAGHVSGRVWTPKDVLLDLPGSPAVNIRYDATVDADVVRPGAVTATLTGEAAMKSPQMRAVAAFFGAMRSGDAAALSSACAIGQGELFTGPDGRQFLAGVKQGVPDLAKVRALKVIVRGGLAVVTGKAPEPVGEVAMKCVLQGGRWRVSLN